MIIILSRLQKLRVRIAQITLISVIILMMIDGVHGLSLTLIACVVVLIGVNDPYSLTSKELKPVFLSERLKILEWIISIIIAVILAPLINLV